MSSPAERARQAVLLSRGWGRRELVPFDEVAAVDGGGVVLTNGDRRGLPERSRARVEEALAVPQATGRPAADAAAWSAYLQGPSWSPRRAAEALVAMAAAAGASDVHVEAGPDGFHVRLRITGVVAPFSMLSAEVGARLVAALKNAASCLPYRSDLVQEGRIPRDGVAADVRASFLPTAIGERAALRLFGRLSTLEELGLPESAEGALREMLDAGSGLVLVAGPSGGGKTTTVYAALQHLATHRGGAHLSIEDPVEQRLRAAGIPVDQVELRPERGLTAEAALAGALRQDVDVIALAEIRTAAEAALALHAAHTGRLVVAGLHAGSAVEARRRMLDLGADPAVLDDTLRGVLHQRLEASPCADASPGCPRCRGTGRLRRPAAEVWVP